MTDKDHALISTLIKGTEIGRMEWTPTALENEFTASVKGKFNVTIHRLDPSSFHFQMVDQSGRELLGVYINQDSTPYYDYSHMESLFEIAQRQALAVDAAIDEIIGEIES